MSGAPEMTDLHEREPDARADPFNQPLSVICGFGADSPSNGSDTPVARAGSERHRDRNLLSRMVSAAFDRMSDRYSPLAEKADLMTSTDAQGDPSNQPVGAICGTGAENLSTDTETLVAGAGGERHNPEVEAITPEAESRHHAEAETLSLQHSILQRRCDNAASYSMVDEAYETESELATPPGSPPRARPAWAHCWDYLPLPDVEPPEYGAPGRDPLRIALSFSPENWPPQPMAGDEGGPKGCKDRLEKCLSASIATPGPRHAEKMQQPPRQEPRSASKRASASPPADELHHRPSPASICQPRRVSSSGSTMQEVESASTTCQALVLRCETPQVKRRRQSDSFLLVPAPATPQSAPSTRPQRRRIPPLDHWRNERPVYERRRGSLTPSLAGTIVVESAEKQAAPRRMRTAPATSAIPLEDAPLKPRPARRASKLPSSDKASVRKRPATSGRVGALRDAASSSRAASRPDPKPKRGPGRRQTEEPEPSAGPMDRPVDARDPGAGSRRSATLRRPSAAARVLDLAENTAGRKSKHARTVGASSALVLADLWEYHRERTALPKPASR